MANGGRNFGQKWRHVAMAGGPNLGLIGDGSKPGIDVFKLVRLNRS